MSGLISQHFIDDLIARADIIEVVGKRIQLNKSGREFKANCPFHDEKTPSFTVSPAKGFYHCFGCGAHGTTLGFLMEYDHMSFVEAVESLASLMGIEVPREEGQHPTHRYDELFELLAKVERYYQANLKNNDTAQAYLKGRGIDGATAKRFGIGCTSTGWSAVLNKFGTSNKMTERLLAVGLVIRKANNNYYDRFRDRIIFPIRDSRGRCIGFGGRVMGNDEPKYLNSPETALFHKGRELYGLYEARQAIRNIEKLVVVEGYMDVISLAQHSIDFVVATLGTATSNDHLTHLFRLTEQVFFCFDGDSAGQAAAWRALETSLPQIREGRQIYFIFLPENQDPDSFVRNNGAKAFEEMLDKSVPLSNFLIEELTLKVNMDSVDGRARLAELAKPLVQRIPQGVYRELLTKRLAETIGLPILKLNSLLSQDKATSQGQRSAKGITGIRSAQAKSKSGDGNPSIIRWAITLLLHHPETGQNLDVEKLAGVTRAGAALLRELIETVQAEPNITTAGILERWRNREESKHLGKLAAVEVPDDEDFDASAELEQSLDQLAAFRRREQIDNLIKKEKPSALSEAERTELREHRRGSKFNISS
jgi:DNA primase